MTKKNPTTNINEEDYEFFNLKKYLNLIFRNKQIISLSSIIFFLAACMYSLTMKRIWQGNFQIVIENSDTEVFLVPRINEVMGITQTHLGQWGWNMNDRGWINYPDYQTRILQNNSEIKWHNKVHEVLKGHKKFSTLPTNEEYSLWHPKDITRQEIQNKFYDTI